MSIERPSRRSRRMLRMAAGVVLTLLAGCGALLGFDDDYTVAPDGSAMRDGDVGPDTGLQVRKPLDDCNPTFKVSNGIQYPDRSQGDLVFDTGGNEKIDTDHDPRCDASTPQHCVIVAKSIRLPFGADKFGTVVVRGSRALVLLAAYDVSIEGVLTVGGYDGAAGDVERNGPGDHSIGTALDQGGGGGLATPGGGDCGRRNAGSNVPLGLYAGGDGAPYVNHCTAGGGGGGALQIVSLCGTIHIDYYINARGGGGLGGGQSNASCLKGHGGGAGGTVWLQGRVEFADPQEIPLPIQLNGGGGGGGACVQPDGTIVPGGMGIGGEDNRPVAAGGTCEGGKIGGKGGLGGFQGEFPTQGEQSTPMDGTTYCGGGGGSRGRLVLQNAERTCAGLEVHTDGECRIADPL